MEQHFIVKFMGKCTFASLALLPEDYLTPTAHRWCWWRSWCDLEETTDAKLREKCQNIYSMKQTFLTAVFERFFYSLSAKQFNNKESNCESVWVSSMTNAGMSFNSTLCRCHVTPSHTSRHHTQTTTQSSCECLVSRSVLESRVWSGPLRSGSVWVQDPQVRRHPPGAIVAL